MYINLNQTWTSMNKFEVTACYMLWAEKHSTLCNMFDALSKLATLNPENGEFTAKDINVSGATLSRIMNTNEKRSFMPFVVARKMPCKIKIPVWVWDKPYNYCDGIMGEGHTEYKEIDKEVNVYKLQWTSNELKDFVKTVAKMARVII